MSPIRAMSHAPYRTRQTSCAQCCLPRAFCDFQALPPAQATVNSCREHPPRSPVTVGPGCTSHSPAKSSEASAHPGHDHLKTRRPVIEPPAQAVHSPPQYSDQQSYMNRRLQSHDFAYPAVLSFSVSSMSHPSSPDVPSLSDLISSMASSP